MLRLRDCDSEGSSAPVGLVWAATDDRLVMAAMASRRPVLGESAAETWHGAPTSIKHVVACPLLVGGEVVGPPCQCRRSTRPFTEVEASTLRSERSEPGSGSTLVLQLPAP